MNKTHGKIMPLESGNLEAFSASRTGTHPPVHSPETAKTTGCAAVWTTQSPGRDESTGGGVRPISARLSVQKIRVFRWFAMQQRPMRSARAEAGGV